MRILLENIQEGVSTLEFACEPEEIELEAEGVVFLAPVAVKLSLFKQYDKVYIKAELSLTIESGCSRCLKPVRIALKGAFENQYRPLPKTTRDVLDDIGIRYYSDEYIDLSADSRESLILELPAKFLCSENCRGLCPQCGENLNETECDCILEPEEIRNSKFAELTKLLVVNKKGK